MRITIKEDQKELVISNDSLDNPNFVDVRIVIEDKVQEITVALDDIMPALIAFDTQRSRLNDRDRQFQ